MSDDTAAKRAVPGDNASDPQRRAWLGWAFGVPHGSTVGEVIRYGAAGRTPMTVEIVPPGDGKPRVVRIEEERDAGNHGKLRAALISDGGVRAAEITSAKVAGDAYYVMCRLAKVVGGVGPLDETWEWLSGYRAEAKRQPYSFVRGELYATLDALRRYPYSKRQINLWIAEMERRHPGDPPGPEPPRPPLAVDGRGSEWTSVTHLATYIRWGRDQPGVINCDSLASRIVELGGGRWKATAWDGTTRERRRRITTVLVRFPPLESEPISDEEPGDV